jgi:hypothetical protein
MDIQRQSNHTRTKKRVSRKQVYNFKKTEVTLNVWVFEEFQQFTGQPFLMIIAVYTHRHTERRLSCHPASGNDVAGPIQQ